MDAIEDSPRNALNRAYSLATKHPSLYSRNSEFPITSRFEWNGNGW